MKLRGVELVHHAFRHIRRFHHRNHQHIGVLRNDVHIFKRLAEVVDDRPFTVAVAFLYNALIGRIVCLQHEVVEVIFVALIEVGILPDVDLGDGGVPNVHAVLFPYLAQGEGNVFHRFLVLVARGGALIPLNGEILGRLVL